MTDVARTAEDEGRATRRGVAETVASSRDASFDDELRAGLARPQKRTPPVFFYDAEGSALYDAITRQPEYYLTETERSILRANADDILAAAARGRRLALVELGAGSSDKTRALLEALVRRQGDARYVPIDVSPDAVLAGAEALRRAFPSVDVRPVVGRNRAALRALAGDEPRLVLFIGSSIGNYGRDEAVAFLADVAATLGPRDALLLGTDLVKSKETLDRAYDDAAGATARFNKNVLARLNREYGADFDLDAFEHRAFFDPAEGRVEMHLVSRRPQRVRVPGLGLALDFAEGETIHTEDSHKYTPEGVRRMVEAAGFRLERSWTDARRWFAVHLLRPDFTDP